MSPRQMTPAGGRTTPRRVMVFIAVVMIAYGAVALLREHRSYGSFILALGVGWAILALLWRDDRRV